MSALMHLTRSLNYGSEISKMQLAEKKKKDLQTKHLFPFVTVKDKTIT